MSSCEVEVRTERRGDLGGGVEEAVGIGGFVGVLMGDDWEVTER